MAFPGPERSLKNTAKILPSIYKSFLNVTSKIKSRIEQYIIYMAIYGNLNIFSMKIAYRKYNNRGD